MNKQPTAFWIGLTVVIVVVGLWVGTTIYSECRAYGHSVLYCIKMATR